MEQKTSSKLDLTKVINTNKIYVIDDFYNDNRVVKALNKFNKLDILPNEVTINHDFDGKYLTIYAKPSSKKYIGKTTIKYRDDHHIPYVVTLSIGFALALIAIGVLFPIGVINLDFNKTIFYASLGVISCSLIIILVALIA